MNNEKGNTNQSNLDDAKTRHTKALMQNLMSKINQMDRAVNKLTGHESSVKHNKPQKSSVSSGTAYDRVMAARQEAAGKSSFEVKTFMVQPASDKWRSKVRPGNDIKNKAGSRSL